MINLTRAAQFFSPEFSAPMARQSFENIPDTLSPNAASQHGIAQWVPINKSFITLTKIILRSASERFGLVNVAVTLRCVTWQGYRHLILTSDDQLLMRTTAGKVTGTTMGKVEEFIISTEMPMTPASERLNVADAVSIPLDFQQQRLGYIVASVRNTAISKDHMAANLAMLAQELAAIIKRYQIRHRAAQVYGEQSYWIGNSSVLRQLDARIDKLAQSSLPILIRANRGAGKIIAARALHCERHADIVPFIDADCGEWQSGAAASILQALYIYAKGGSLYLRNIDKLSPGNFHALQQFCFLRLAEAVRRNGVDSLDLIFSVSERSATLTPELNQWLELHSKELQLPDLNERVGDFRDLARFFIHQYALNKCFDLTESAWELLEQRTGLGSVDQLRSLIQTIAPKVEGILIDQEQLESLLI